MSSRLYKAVGATGSSADNAVVALDENLQAPRLQTRKVHTSISFVSTPDAPEGPAVLDAVEPAILESVSARTLTPMDPVPTKEALTEFEHLFDAGSQSPEQAPDSAHVSQVDDDEWEEVEIRTFNWRQISLLLGIIAIVLGLISGLLFSRFGLPVGVPFFVVAVLLAIRSDFDDRWAVAVMTPLAWLIAIVGPGQLTVTHDGSALLTQALLVFQGLSDNAVWIIGSVLAATGIAVARTRRGY